MFKDISTFDTQNPVVGLLLKELHLGKKGHRKYTDKKAPSTVDVEMQSRYNALKNNLTFFNWNNDNSNNLPPPPLPPFQPPPSPPPPPTFRQPPSLLTNFITLPSWPVSNNFEVLRNLSTASQTTLFGELTIGKQERTFNDKKQEILKKQTNRQPPKPELDDSLLNVLSAKEDDILSTDYISNKELNEKKTEDINKEYDFENIKNILAEGNIPQQPEFFFGGDNENFLIACNLLGLNKDNNEFISFLCSDHGQNILIENRLSIHIRNRNCILW